MQPKSQENKEYATGKDMMEGRGSEGGRERDCRMEAVVEGGGKNMGRRGGGQGGSEGGEGKRGGRPHEWGEVGKGGEGKH